MKPEQLLDAMNGIDDKILEVSEKEVKKVIKFTAWMKLAACACVVLVLIGSYNLFYAGMGSSVEESGDVAMDKCEDSGAAENIGSFKFNGIEYIEADEDKLEEIGVTDLNIYDLDESDLGEKIGMISYNGPLDGCIVYYVAGYENDDRICIINKDDTYIVFCKNGEKQGEKDEAGN